MGPLVGGVPATGFGADEDLPEREGSGERTRGSVIDSLIQFERCTRKLEAIHVIAFLGFLAWSLWRAIIRQTTVIDFGIAILVYTMLILSPAMLQRYNRLRVNAVIRRLTARGLRSRHGSAG
jgi:hypothetical protein